MQIWTTVAAEVKPHVLNAQYAYTRWKEQISTNLLPSKSITLASNQGVFNWGIPSQEKQ